MTEHEAWALVLGHPGFYRLNHQGPAEWSVMFSPCTVMGVNTGWTVHRGTTMSDVMRTAALWIRGAW